MSWKDSLKGSDVMDMIRDAPDDGVQIELPPPNAISFTCPVCGHQLSRIDVPLAYTSEHLQFYHSVESPECFEKLKEIQRQEKETRARETRLYKCEECEAEVYGYNAFLAHKSGHSVQNAKSTSKKEKCPFCEVSDNSTNVIRHIRAKHVTRGESNNEEANCDSKEQL